MRTTQIFFNRLMAILNARGLSLAWIEEKTGISEVFLATFEYIASGLSFQLVLKVAVALGVSIESLISEDCETREVSYGESLPRLLISTSTDISGLQSITRQIEKARTFMTSHGLRERRLQELSVALQEIRTSISKEQKR